MKSPNPEPARLPPLVTLPSPLSTYTPKLSFSTKSDRRRGKSEQHLQCTTVDVICQEKHGYASSATVTKIRK